MHPVLLLKQNPGQTFHVGEGKDFLPHLYVSDFQFLSDGTLMISEGLKNSCCLVHNDCATVISQCFTEAGALVQTDWQSAWTCFIFVEFVGFASRNWVNCSFAILVSLATGRWL